MSGITKGEAIAKLMKGIEGFPVYDLVEVYNELFPRKPVRLADVNGDSARLLEAIMARINRGLELDEIIDLWNVVFPEEPSLFWDEEEDRFDFEPALEPWHYEE